MATSLSNIRGCRHTDGCRCKLSGEDCITQEGFQESDCGHYLDAHCQAVSRAYFAELEGN
jgi:hypothetical protein